MCGSTRSLRNAVVGADVNHLHFVERAHADRGRAVQLEHGERRSNRDKSLWRVCGDSIRNGHHRMLTSPVMDVAASIGRIVHTGSLRAKHFLRFLDHEVGFGKICRTGDERHNVPQESNTNAEE